MVEERRQSPRHAASLNAQIETETGRTTIAITQDVSAVGLLVLSHRALQVGKSVTIYVLAEGNQYVVNGTVVREEPAGQGELWQWRAAVAIDPQEADLEKILAAIESQPAS
jgi:hypothetical protein